MNLKLGMQLDFYHAIIKGVPHLNLFGFFLVNSEHIVERVIAHHHYNGAYMSEIVSSGV